MSLYSLFETPIMECSLSAFGEQYNEYPWCEEQPPISRQEIADILMRPEELIAPGLFVDTIVDSGERCNFSATRNEHLKRIGWLVLNWDLTSNNALTALEVSDMNVLNLTDGYHRYLAAWYREEKSVLVRIEMGSKASLEQIPSFIRWIQPPAATCLFGVNIISSVQDACEFKWDGANRFWLNDGLTGMCLASLREGMLLQRYRRNLESAGGLISEDATRHNMIEFMFEEYPNFVPFKQQAVNAIKELVDPL